jgi:hypothetical protein
LKSTSPASATENGNEWAGPCPVHRPKKNNTAFSYAKDGRWNCFACGEKGRGAIDLLMKAKNMRFQDAVAALETVALSSAKPKPQPSDTADEEQSVSTSENPPFKSSYSKFQAESVWLANRALSTATLERYGVFQYENPARRSPFSGSVMLKISRYIDGESTEYVNVR